MGDPIKSALRQAYDADAARRSALEISRWRRDVVDRFLHQLYDRSLNRILDAGCGTGQIASHMAGRDFDVVGVDLSPANVEATRHRGIEAHIGDFSTLAFDDGSFGGVLAFNSLLHVPKDGMTYALAEMRRVLVDGGLLQMVVWGGVDYEGPHESDWLEPQRYFSFFSDPDFLALEAPGSRRLETRLLHEYEEEGGLRLHPQAALFEAV